MPKLRPVVYTVLATISLITLASTTHADQEQNRRIRLRYMTPSTFITVLRSFSAESPNLVPKGVTSLGPDDLNHGLLVKADEDGMAKLEELIRLMDVPNSSIRFVLRLMRTTDNPRSAPQVLATAVGETRNNNPRHMPVLAEGKFADLTVTPHVNGDGSISVAVEMDLSAWNGPTTAAEPGRGKYTTTTMIQNGETKFVTSFNQGTFTKPDRFAAQADTLWVDVTPTIVPALPATGR